MGNFTLRHVEKTWDLIAESFNNTRRRPWQQVIEFIDEQSPIKMSCDLGCGNGRHLLPLAKYSQQTIGFDLSRNLLKIARQHCLENKASNIRFIQGSLTDLPFCSNSCNVILCIASLHMIPGKVHRIQTLKEIYRILHPGGKAMITVWSRWQDKFFKAMLKQKIIRDYQYDVGDVIVPWSLNGQSISRFYHLYTKREFISDIKTTGLRIESIYKEHLTPSRLSDNLFVVVKK